jgi:hypothetical protein
MGKKKDIKQVDALAAKYRMSPEERAAFGEYIHSLKRIGHRGGGTGGDFTFKELEALAREIKGLTDENE